MWGAMVVRVDHRRGPCDDRRTRSGGRVSFRQVHAMNSPALVRPPFSRPVHRRGLSLMELLIATTISIMVMGATVTLFGVVGERINGGRAMIEVADRLRSTQSLLHHDLRGVTVSFLPWEQASAGNGYFEILKGPATNNPATSNRDSLPGSANVTLGYTQDVLMF